MAEMGDGYGSECHLLRYLGRHRQRFDEAVQRVTGGTKVTWLDYPFDRRRRWLDREWTGLDFLTDEERGTSAWESWWPQTGSPPNWDAVGKVSLGGADEWLLVEAKANCQELRSSCQAGDNSRKKIQGALSETKAALGVSEGHDWLNGYYQFCNRIGILYFLNKQQIPARMMFIYFTGDERGDSVECPANEAGWNDELVRLEHHVGLVQGHKLADRVHKLFLPVCEDVPSIKRPR